MSDELKKLIVDSIGQSPQITKSSNKPKEKKKIKVDDLKLYGGATRVIGVNDFKHHDKAQYKIRMDVFQWTNRDIALYISEKYYKKYGRYWDVPLVGVSRHADRIKKSLFDLLGFCDTVVVKDFLDYFFQYWSDLYVMGKEKTLRFHSLLQDDPIDEFVKDYNYSERVQHYISGDDSKYEGKLPEIDVKKIDNSYQLGVDNLILDYGIIIAVNYLIKHGKRQDQAIKLVGDASVRICRESDHSLISEITNAYSPYSSKMIFKDSDLISNLIRSRIGKNVVFNIAFLDNANRWEYFEYECSNGK